MVHKALHVWNFRLFTAATRPAGQPRSAQQEGHVGRPLSETPPYWSLACGPALRDCGLDDEILPDPTLPVLLPVSPPNVGVAAGGGGGGGGEATGVREGQDGCRVGDETDPAIIPHIRDRLVGLPPKAAGVGRFGVMPVKVPISSFFTSTLEVGGDPPGF